MDTQPQCTVSATSSFASLGKKTAGGLWSSMETIVELLNGVELYPVLYNFVLCCVIHMCDLISGMGKYTYLT